jgi:Raf kinase inhibitor-like YbhB/YbcL family protein
MVRIYPLLLIAAILVSGCTSAENTEVGSMGMQLSSPAFTDNGNIPARFTCQGEDINPRLDIEGVPEGAKSLVLIMDDPDAPMGTWDHWVVFNMDPATKTIAENSVPSGAVQGTNGWGNSEYPARPAAPTGTCSSCTRLTRPLTSAAAPRGAMWSAPCRVTCWPGRRSPGGTRSHRNGKYRF